MANWLLPALKAVLPHVGGIISAGKPAFTRRNPEAAANQDLIPQQIAELQAAASQQSAHTKELAAQLESTVAALQQAAEVAEARLKRVLLFSALALSFSVAALAVSALGALLR